MIYSPWYVHGGCYVLITAEDRAGGGGGGAGLNSPAWVGREEAQTAAESAWGQQGEAGQAPIPQQLVSSWSLSSPLLSPPGTAPGTGRGVRGEPAEPFASLFFPAAFAEALPRNHVADVAAFQGTKCRSFSLTGKESCLLRPSWREKEPCGGRRGQERNPSSHSHPKTLHREP